MPLAPKLTLAPESAVLALRGSLRLSATVTGAAGDTVVNYRSRDTAVVRVDSGVGIVRAVGYGSAWVSASLRGSPAIGDSVRVSVPVPTGPWLVLRPDTQAIYLNWSGQVTWRVGNSPDSAVRLTTSDSSVIEARPSGLLCPRKPGSTLVRGSLAAYPSVMDSVRVRVLDASVLDAPPTVSIASIVDTAGKAVDLTAVRGVIRVNVGVDTPPWRCLPPFVLQLLFDGKLWQAGPPLEWGGAAFIYTFTVDTRATDATGLPLLPNGTHTLSVLGRRTDGIVMMSTSLSIRVSN